MSRAPLRQMVDALPKWGQHHHLGTGSIDVAHQPNEYVKIEELNQYSMP